MFINLIKDIYAAEDLSTGNVASSSSIIPTDPLRYKFNSVGDIVSKLLPYIYVAAGLVLLLMLISGGIGLMTSGGNPDKMKEGYGRITSALIGFLIVFISYIVMQLVGTILGVDIL